MAHTLTKLKKRRGLLIGLGILAVILLISLLIPPPGNVARGQESLQSASAHLGSIASTVSGTGNLETEGGESVMIPTGLTVQDVFVEPGDLVSAGDVLAVFELGSIQSRLAEIYDELDDLDEEIEDARSESESTTIAARVAGRVETIYAEVDVPVADTVIAHGALLTLAIDGDQTLDVTGAAGTISRIHVQEGDRVRAGDTLFTLTELDVSSAYHALVAERAELTDTLRSLLALAGTGELIAEFDGIIEHSTLGGSTSGSTPALPINSLPANVPNGMFGLMSHTPDTNDSPLGIVRLSDSYEAPAPEPTPEPAANTTQYEAAPVTTDEPVPTEEPPPEPAPEPPPEPAPEPPPPPEPTVLTSISGLSLAAPSVGGSPQRGVSGSGFSGTVQWQPAHSTFQAGTVYQAMVVLTANGGAIFGQEVFNALSGSFPAAGASVTNIQVGSPAHIAVTLAFPPTAAVLDVPQNTPQPQQPSPSTPQQPQQPGTPVAPSPDMPGGMPPGMAGGGMPGGMPSFAMPSFSMPPAFPMPDMDAPALPGIEELASTANQLTAFSISRAYTMRLTVTVDERDILSLSVGQPVEVTLDAAVGELFYGEISRINTAGVASGGGARYTVEISLPRTDQMLPGMSASAVITTDEAAGILLIPAEAIQEEGLRSFVYTAQENNLPTNPVDVQTGLSDGVFVEVLAGLDAGTTVYYTVPDTPRWSAFGMPGLNG